MRQSRREGDKKTHLISNQKSSSFQIRAQERGAEPAFAGPARLESAMPPTLKSRPFQGKFDIFPYEFTKSVSSYMHFLIRKCLLFYYRAFVAI